MHHLPSCSLTPCSPSLTSMFITPHVHHLQTQSLSLTIMLNITHHVQYHSTCHQSLTMFTITNHHVQNHSPYLSLNDVNLPSCSPSNHHVYHQSPPCSQITQLHSSHHVHCHYNVHYQSLSCSMSMFAVVHSLMFSHYQVHYHSSIILVFTVTIMLITRQHVHYLG